MKPLLPFMLSFVLMNTLRVQPAIISNPDGYVNIRGGRSKDSKITGLAIIV